MKLDAKTIYTNGLIWLPKAKIRSIDQVKSALTFAYGDSTYKAAKVYTLYVEHKDHIGVPRHFLSRESILNLSIPIVDLRPRTFDEVDVRSLIELDRVRPELRIQNEAVLAMMDSAKRDEDGIISLSCGSGKTPVALHYWAQLCCPLLVMADNTSILEQWERMIRLFISPSDIPIGHVYDGRSEWNRPVVLASVQSVYPLAGKLPPEIKRRFGLVVIDEIHKVAAPVYCRVAPVFPGARIGLTATPYRTDRLEAVYQAHFGKVIYTYLGQPLKPKFYFYTPMSTNKLMDDPAFRASIMSWGEVHISKMWTALARHPGRINEISSIIVRLMSEGRRILVISQRKDLLRELNQRIPRSGLVISDTDLRRRTEILARAPVVLGIMGIAKEGLDSATLDTLVICEPFKDQNLFQQVVGRILRDHPGKQPPIVLIIQDTLGDGAGPVYGLCRKLKGIITGWPAEMGGPYAFEDWEG